MNELYSIRMTGEPNLQHWKYIKKVKTSGGKWRYIYDDSELKKYENNRSNNFDRNNTHYAVKYKQTNDLLSGRTTFSTYGLGSPHPHNSKYIVNEQGKLDRWYAKGEKFIYKSIYSHLSSSNRVSKAARKGRDFIKKVIKR